MYRVLKYFNGEGWDFDNEVFDSAKDALNSVMGGLISIGGQFMIIKVVDFKEVDGE